MITTKDREVSLVDEGWAVSAGRSTDFTNINGVYQDGTLAICRDPEGILWSLIGHTNLGGVSLWCGTSIDNLKKQGMVNFNFQRGRAGQAFNGISYPDGPRSRGGLWPCGLWIDPENGRFYCFIHNETGWEAEDTSYTIFGLKEGEPDFRHVGLMTSDDRGKSWDFQGWVITSFEPCWSEYFQPDGMVGGQKGNTFCLGAGDFSLFTNKRDGFFYIFYTQIFYNIDTKTCYDRVYAARSPIITKGLPGTWQKLYNGGYSEPGNMGRETAILENANIPCVAFNTHLGKYLMTSYRRDLWIAGKGACQTSSSDDLIRWSPAKPLDPTNTDLSKPYFTQCNPAAGGIHNETGKTFRILMESNGTDVEQVDVTLP